MRVVPELGRSESTEWCRPFIHYASSQTHDGFLSELALPRELITDSAYESRRGDVPPLRHEFCQCVRVRADLVIKSTPSSHQAVDIGNLPRRPLGLS